MAAQKTFQKISESYGDLIYDLCSTFLPEQQATEEVFLQALQRVRSALKSESYQQYERGWVLRQVCTVLLESYPRYARQVSPEEQIRLDNEKSSNRLAHFALYFHRLDPVNQLVLLLKDRLHLPNGDVALALGIPEGTLKLRRQQALHTLEDWLWIKK